MDLKIWRNYHEALRRLGVKNPGEVAVQAPIQLEATLDDLSHLTPPLQVPVVAIYNFQAAVIGDWSGFELEARSGGCWIEYLAQWDRTGVLATYDATRGDVARAVIAPLCTFGPPMQSVFASVVSNTNPIAAVGVFQLRANWQMGASFFLPPGRILGMFDDAANTVSEVAMVVREVPLRLPGDE